MATFELDELSRAVAQVLDLKDIEDRHSLINSAVQRLRETAWACKCGPGCACACGVKCVCHHPMRGSQIPCHGDAIPVGSLPPTTKTEQAQPQLQMRRSCCRGNTENSDSSVPGAPVLLSKKRRSPSSRTKEPISGEQLRVLERAFAQHPYVSSEACKSLSEQLGLPRKKITKWFDNNRAKQKRLAGAKGKAEREPTRDDVAMSDIQWGAVRVPDILDTEQPGLDVDGGRVHTIEHDTQRTESALKMCCCSEAECMCGDSCPGHSEHGVCSSQAHIADSEAQLQWLIDADDDAVAGALPAAIGT